MNLACRHALSLYQKSISGLFADVSWLTQQFASALTFPWFILNSDTDMSSRSLANDPIQIITRCAVCGDKEATIFQLEGDYCLDCWQKKTHPNV
jgi:hypothetical protein